MSDALILNNGNAFIDGSFHLANLRCENGVIAEISTAPFDGGEDLTGKYVLPGLVDIHTHGCAGYDFSTASVEEMAEITKMYASKGVTSVLATTITMPEEEYARAVTRIGQAYAAPRCGAKICGINMEGPFLSRAKKGAHDERYIIPPNPALFERLNALSGKIIKIVDIDPSADGAAEFIEAYKKEFVISIAHTPVDYQGAVEAIKRGASHITHLFNAMNVFTHRDPGVVGAFCDNAETGVNAELIADGFHVHPAAIRLMFKACPGRIALISDSMCAAGMPDGEYELGGLAVLVGGGKAVLRDAPETIAGSATNVFDCMRGAIKFGIKKEYAIAAATQVPADIIGIKAGRIAKGYAADLLVSDNELNLERIQIAPL